MEIIFEIPIRQFLYEKKCNRLIDIPDSYWSSLASQNYSSVWLLGIWQISPISLQHALEYYPDQIVFGSCFAIEDYTLDQAFVNSLELEQLKTKLNKLGLKLILDFIPNHFGISRKLLNQNPKIFLESDSRDFVFEYNQKKYANAKDPYFEPWTDTLQLDYTKQETHEFMSQKLMGISELCDGVRCDMAMLLLPEIFSITHKVKSEQVLDFWQPTISRIKELNSNFLFIAEVYWGLENQLLDLGFDLVYNKQFLDNLKSNNLDIAKLQSENPRYLVFLENHDEERSTAIFDDHKLAEYTQLLWDCKASKLLYYGQDKKRTDKTIIQIPFVNSINR